MSYRTWQWSGCLGTDLHEALQQACVILRQVESYLEIGVDGGGSLHTVLLCGVPSRIVLCDVWNPAYCAHGETKRHVRKILRYFKAEARFLDGDSTVHIPTLREQFDLVLVDGDHSADGAAVDLQNAWPLVRSGGILVMDDIHHPEYPWLGTVWQQQLQGWIYDPITELHGNANAAMIQKP